MKDIPVERLPTAICAMLVEILAHQKAIQSFVLDLHVKLHKPDADDASHEQQMLLSYANLKNQIFVEKKEIQMMMSALLGDLTDDLPDGIEPSR